MLFFFHFFCRYFYNSLFCLQELTWVETLVKILLSLSPKSQSTFIALFVYLSFALSSLFLHKKCMVLFQEEKLVPFLLKFSRFMYISLSNGTREPKDVSFTFVQCLFCKNSFAFRADFLQQCNKIYRLTSKRLLFWCYSPCPEDSEKDCCSNKIKTCYYLLHMQALKKALDWWSGLFLLYNSSQCLAICNVLGLTTTSCSLQYGYEIFMFVRKCYCDN